MLEATVLAIGRGVRFGETDRSALAIEIQAIVGEHERAFADASVAPGDTTVIEIHRGQDGARKTIEVIADEHRARVVIAHILGEVDLLRRIPPPDGVSSRSAAPVP